MKTPALPSGMMTLRKEMDRLFDRLWDRDLFETPEMIEGWAPAVDLDETDQAIEIRVDVPGMDAKDIHVHVRDNVLMLRGERRYEVEHKDARRYRSERMFGAFSRQLALPVPVDATKVNATVRNGVLTVKLPKVASSKDLEVPVLVG